MFKGPTSKGREGKGEVIGNGKEEKEGRGWEGRGKGKGSRVPQSLPPLHSYFDHCAGVYPDEFHLTNSIPSLMRIS